MVQTIIATIAFFALLAAWVVLPGQRKNLAQKEHREDASEKLDPRLK